MKKFTQKIDEIIVHCTATPPSQQVTVNDLRAWHRARGFDDIGYHYVVMADGSIAEGRSREFVGAHCRGHNAHSIGVAYAGGVDAEGRPADTRTPQQRESLEFLLGYLSRLYDGARIHGHRDFAAKACPSFDATTEYSHLNTTEKQ